MKAAVWHGQQRIVFEDRPDPEAEPGWVLVQPELTGLCGTDVAIFADRHERAQPPRVLGHEMVGCVETSTPTSPPPGTRVAVNPLLHCNSCWSCLNGHPHTCARLHLIGIDRDGSMAELVAVPESALVPLSASSRPTSAVLVEPLAVALHAVRQAEIHPGQTVLILGGGPIGVLTALAARETGAAQIIVNEPNSARLAIAESLGFIGLGTTGAATVTGVLDLTGGLGAAVTFDTAGHPSVPPILAAVTRAQGTVVLAGLHHKPEPVDLHAVAFAEQRIVGSRVYRPEDFRAAVDSVNDNRHELHRLPVQTFGLHEAEEACRVASGSPYALKVAVSSATPA